MIYFNYPNQQLVTSGGARSVPPPKLSYLEKAQWWIQVLDNADPPQPIDLSAAVACRAAIDIDRQTTTEPMCRTFDADIDKSRLADGIIGVQVDAATTTFLSKVNGKKALDAEAEVWFYDADGKVIFYLIFPIVARMPIDPEGVDPLAVPVNAVDRTYTDALFNGLSAVVAAITAQLTGFVKKICGKTPNENGEVDLDLDDLADGTGIISGLQTAIAEKSAIGHTHADKADLIDGKVPAAQLPSYVSDITEAANVESFPETGEAARIYVALDTGKTYRWGGSTYVEISEAPQIGDTAGTVFAGERGKALEEAAEDLDTRVAALESAPPSSGGDGDSQLGVIVSIDADGIGTVQPVVRNVFDTGWQSDGSTITARLFGAMLQAGVFGIVFGERCFGAFSRDLEEPLIHMWYPHPGSYCVCRISRWALGCKKTTVYYLANPEDQMPSERYEYSDPKYAVADVTWSIVLYDPANGHDIPYPQDDESFYYQLDIAGFVEASTAAALQSYVDARYADGGDFCFATGRDGFSAPLLSSYYDDGSTKEPNIVDPVAGSTGVLLQALYAPGNSYHDGVHVIPDAASGGAYVKAIERHLATLLPTGTLPVYTEDSRNE